MIRAFYRPRRDDVLLTDADGVASIAFPAQQAEHVVGEIAEALEVPALARGLANGTRVSAPMLTAWNAV